MAVPPIGGALGIGVFNTDITGGSRWKFQNAKDAPNQENVVNFQSDMAKIYYRYNDLDKLKVSDDISTGKYRSLTPPEKALLKSTLNIEIQNLVRKHRDPQNFTEIPRDPNTDALLALLDDGVEKIPNYEIEMRDALNHIRTKINDDNIAGEIQKVLSGKWKMSLPRDTIDKFDDKKTPSNVKAAKESLNLILSMAAAKTQEDKAVIQQCIREIVRRFGSKDADKDESISTYSVFVGYMNKYKLNDLIDNAIRNAEDQAHIPKMARIDEITNEMIAQYQIVPQTQATKNKIAELRTELELIRNS